MSLLNLGGSALLTEMRFTSTSLAATGATGVVAAPAAGISTVVYIMRVVLTTSTTGYIETFLRDGAGGNAMFRSTAIGTVGAVSLTQELTNPWVLTTATALQIVATISAASTPGAEVMVGYRLWTR